MMNLFQLRNGIDDDDGKIAIRFCKIKEERKICWMKYVSYPSFSASSITQLFKSLFRPEAEIDESNQKT